MIKETLQDDTAVIKADAVAFKKFYKTILPKLETNIPKETNVKTTSDQG